MPGASLAALKERLGIEFTDHGLAEQALTHSSWSYERHDGTPDNERLEFLGDAALSLSVSEILFLRFPDASEGYLARLKSVVVSERTLANVASGMGFGSALRLGKGEDRSGGRLRTSLLANALEALLGAWYLDAGYTACRDLVARVLGPEIDAAVREGNRSAARTELQELAQQELGISPEYRLVKQVGPDNDRVFTMEVHLAGQPYGTGDGRTKKDACQSAAREALERLRGEFAGQRLPGPLADLARARRNQP